MKDSEIGLVMRLIGVAFEVADSVEGEQRWVAAYGRLLDKTDPTRIDLVMSLTLLRHVYIWRKQIGAPWTNFRDRVRAHIVADHPDRDADRILAGLDR